MHINAARTYLSIEHNLMTSAVVGKQPFKVIPTDSAMQLHHHGAATMLATANARRRKGERIAKCYDSIYRLNCRVAQFAF